MRGPALVALLQLAAAATASEEVRVATLPGTAALPPNPREHPAACGLLPGDRGGGVCEYTDSDPGDHVFDRDTLVGIGASLGRIGREARVPCGGVRTPLRLAVALVDRATLVAGSGASVAAEARRYARAVFDAWGLGGDPHARGCSRAVLLLIPLEQRKQFQVSPRGR